MYARAREPAEDWIANRHRSSSGLGGGLELQAGSAHNANYGVNYGTLNQNSIHYHHYTPSIDIISCLNPILDASHTRNLLHSPPNSECFEGTRVDFIAMVLSWARASVVDLQDHTRIVWIYGYAGCGKSAISLAVAQQLAKEGRLAASFFFFRGAGERAGVSRLIGTIVCQMVAAVPETLPYVERAIRTCPWLLSSSTASLCVQFEELVFKPIAAIVGSLTSGPLTIVFDGVDECKDRNEIGRLIWSIMACFRGNPSAPLRFVIASRVEEHLHQLLHSSNQVCLLDLVNHTTDEDIKIAIETRLEREKSGGALSFNKSWPDPYQVQRLVKHIEKSFIFMTTVLNELFKPITIDGQTPMDRLPVLLGTAPDFDALYTSLLAPLGHVPYSLDVTSTIALAYEALSISQIADLLEINTANVAGILLILQAIMRVPGDDQSPVTLWHTSFRDYLCSQERAGSFFASPKHHLRMAFRSVSIVTSSGYGPAPPASGYALAFAMEHMIEYFQAFHHEPASYDSLLVQIMPDLVKAIFKGGRTALECACTHKKPNWNLVRALINGGADVNANFTEVYLGIDDVHTALHAACYHAIEDIVDLLLNKGADPNLVRAEIDPETGACSGYSTSVLAWAAAEGNAGLVRKLLAYGANPNLIGGDCGSALQCAASDCRLMETSTPVEIARILLEHGANPNVKGDYDYTPLHYAAVSLGPEGGVMECLLEFNADPNIQDDQGRTPLHLLCYEEDEENVYAAKYLLDHGASPDIQTVRGSTPLDWVLSRPDRFPNLSQLLLQYTVKTLAPHDVGPPRQNPLDPDAL